MKKNNNSLLITIISGAVFCFVLMGMVFLFSGKTNNLKSNTSSLNSEINLGDTCYGDWTLQSDYGDYVSGTCSTTAEPTSSTSGTSYVQCTDNQSPGSSVCPSAYISSGCHKARTWIKEEITCPASAPVITCKSNVVYNGTNQTVATCTGGTIIQGGSGLNAGDYHVRCQGDGGLVTKDCVMAKADATITDFDGFELVVGGSKQLNASGPSTVSYSVVSGDSYINLSSDSVTGIAAGTATVRATTEATTNYNAGSKDITVTVTEATVVCNPNEYKVNNKCISCPDGYKASGTREDCYIDVSAGSYLVGGTTQIISCPANTYSLGGRYYLSGGGSDDVVGTESCKSCGAGKTSPIGSTSYSACVTIDDSNSGCSVSISTTAKTVSPNTNECPSDNRYPDSWTVHVEVSGAGCNGATLTMSGDGAEKSGGSESHTVSNGQGFNFIYHATTCCKTAKVTATVTKDNKKLDGKSVTVATSKGWYKASSDVCRPTSEYEANPHSFAEADDQEKDVYYIALNNTKCSGQREVDIYRRGCGGGSTPTAACYQDASGKYHWTAYPQSSWTKTNLDYANCKDEEVKIPYCYVDDDNNYYWTTDPATNWKKIAGITKESDCKEIEDDACYIDTNGNYTWGKHAKDSGYTLVTSIKDADSCKAPVATEACYKNNQDDYIWTTTAPDGYTKVDNVKTPAECAPVEAPACYLYGNNFVWGKYKNVTGYIIIENITDEASCNLPGNDACYVDTSGNYVWGKYENDPKYTLVPSITEMSQCIGGGGDVPVPPTGISASRLVYVFMVILMAFGIGFIYYSSAVKRNS